MEEMMATQQNPDGSTEPVRVSVVEYVDEAGRTMLHVSGGRWFSDYPRDIGARLATEYMCDHMGWTLAGVVQ